MTLNGFLLPLNDSCGWDFLAWNPFLFDLQVLPGLEGFSVTRNAVNQWMRLRIKSQHLDALRQSVSVLNVGGRGFPKDLDIAVEQ